MTEQRNTEHSWSSTVSAMDALEQLQNSGRRICVISHLTEMLDRIPVKIKVSGRGKGKSRIEIIG